MPDDSSPAWPAPRPRRLRTHLWRRLSSLVFRRPSLLLQEIHSNALLVTWSKQHPSPRVCQRRSEMFQFLNLDVLRNGPITYLEFGVYQGKSILEWARLNTHADSRFIGFDTFEGLPEAWDRVHGRSARGRFDVGGRMPETDDPRVRFVKGLFQETVPTFLKDFSPCGRLVVHNDSDLYPSTLYVLTMLNRWLRPGSLVVFDEFYSSSHEFQAFYDYARAYYRTVRVIASVGTDPYRRVAMELVG